MQTTPYIRKQAAALFSMTVSRATPAFPAHPTDHPMPPQSRTVQASIPESDLPVLRSMGKLLRCSHRPCFVASEKIYTQMFSCKRCHGKPQPSEAHLEIETSSTVAMPMPPRALKNQYTDLQLKPICWENSERVTVTSQPCLTIPINYCILKQLLLSQTPGFILFTTANGSHHVWR